MAEAALEPQHLELPHHALTHRDLPSTEQEPVGASVFHLTLQFYCVGGLRHWFGDRRDVLVAGDSFVYYDHVAKDGQVEARSICPDVLVVFGVEHHRQDRGSYVVWDEGPAPKFVLEVASKSTKGRDKGVKRHVYAEMGVSEYFLLDARKTSAAERLQGFKLCKGRYVPLPMVPLPHPAGALRAESIESAHPLLRIGIASDVLGLYLCPGHLDVMRLYDPNTGQYINTHEQALQQAEITAARAAASQAEAAAARTEARLKWKPSACSHRGHHGFQAEAAARSHIGRSSGSQGGSHRGRGISSGSRGGSHRGHGGSSGRRGGSHGGRFGSRTIGICGSGTAVAQATATSIATSVKGSANTVAESALEPRLELLHHALTHRDLPSTEQEPLGGSVFHLTLRFHCVVGLRHWFGDRRDVLVAGNSFVYYDHVAKDGQVEARRICPDVFVVFGVAHHRQDRDSYVVWDEGPAPAFVLEVASKSAKGRDKGMKRHVYAEMGVSEYFLLDARMTSASAAERLQGFKLCKGRYVPLPMVPLPHPAGALRAESIESAHPLLRIGIASDVLGLYLCLAIWM